MNPRIQALDFEKSQQDVEEWVQDIYVDLISIKTYKDTQWFPRRASSCMSFNRKCVFNDNICMSRKPETIMELLKSIQNPEQDKFEPWITLDLEIKG